MPVLQASSKGKCTVQVRCHPPAVITKMEALGARVVTRFSKDVTHIIFQKHAKTASVEQREAEAAELRALYDKIEKVHLLAVRLGGLSAAWPGMACPRSARCAAARQATVGVACLPEGAMQHNRHAASAGVLCDISNIS